MKRAILVVSFGTTHLDTLEKTICAAEREIQNAHPDIPCFRAFTSNIVRRRLRENSGVEVDSVQQALEKLAADGYTHVAIQPTLLLPGEEYDLLRRDALNGAGAMQISIGLPLLWDDRDLETMAEILREAYPLDGDTVLLAMGHGTSHEADCLYSRLAAVMRGQGMELCTVEGRIDFNAAVQAMCDRPQRKAHLVPLLLVAGDHSKNDMAGSEPDSLKSLLEAKGFAVTCSLKGLGELPAVRQAYLDRLNKILC